MNGAKSARPTLRILLFCMFRLLKKKGELSFSNLGCLGGSFNTNMQITLNFTIMFNFSSRALFLDSTRAFHNFQVKLIHICVKLRCSGHPLFETSHVTSVSPPFKPTFFDWLSGWGFCAHSHSCPFDINILNTSVLFDITQSKGLEKKNIKLQWRRRPKYKTLWGRVKSEVH